MCLPDQFFQVGFGAIQPDPMSFPIPVHIPVGQIEVFTRAFMVFQHVGRGIDTFDRVAIAKIPDQPIGSHQVKPVTSQMILDLGGAPVIRLHL